MNTIRNQVKDLWKICFDDTDDFVNLYFNLRYNEEVNLYIKNGNQVISALQMLPYPFTYYQEELQSSYISGACTHPDFRNKGVMRKLLAEAFAKMSFNKVDVSTIIPANDWLFDYYAQSGYVTVFYYAMKDVKPIANVQNSVCIEQMTTFRSDVYDYFNRCMHQRNCCVQHTEKDIQVIMADMKIDKGYIYTARQEDKIVGTVFAYNEDTDLYIVELFADSEDIKQQLISAVHQINTVFDIKMIAPVSKEDEPQILGMIRIINAPKMLQLFANSHPSVEMKIALTDPLLSSNNGCYYLDKGQCIVSRKPLQKEYADFTIADLAKLLFADTNPYMSLMMD
jgi:predicted acetyltransferase